MEHPIIEKKKAEEEEHEKESSRRGYCSDCENYSEDLRLVEGEWLCGECREEKKERVGEEAEEVVIDDSIHEKH